MTKWAYSKICPKISFQYDLLRSSSTKTCFVNELLLGWSLYVNILKKVNKASTCSTFKMLNILCDNSSLECLSEVSQCPNNTGRFFVQFLKNQLKKKKNTIKRVLPINSGSDITHPTPHRWSKLEERKKVSWEPSSQSWTLTCLLQATVPCFSSSILCSDV